MTRRRQTHIRVASTDFPYCRLRQEIRGVERRYDFASPSHTASCRTCLAAAGIPRAQWSAAAKAPRATPQRFDPPRPKRGDETGELFA